MSTKLTDKIIEIGPKNFYKTINKEVIDTLKNNRYENLNELNKQLMMYKILDKDNMLYLRKYIENIKLNHFKKIVSKMDKNHLDDSFRFMEYLDFLENCSHGNKLRLYLYSDYYIPLTTEMLNKNDYYIANRLIDRLDIDKYHKKIDKFKRMFIDNILQYIDKYKNNRECLEFLVNKYSNTLFCFPTVHPIYKKLFDISQNRDIFYDKMSLYILYNLNNKYEKLEQNIIKYLDTIPQLFNMSLPILYYFNENINYKIYESKILEKKKNSLFKNIENIPIDIIIYKFSNKRLNYEDMKTVYKNMKKVLPLIKNLDDNIHNDKLDYYVKSMLKNRHVDLNKVENLNGLYRSLHNSFIKIYMKDILNIYRELSIKIENDQPQLS